MGGIINSDHFEKHPYEAVLLSLTPFYYNGICRREIDAFLREYFFVFEYSGDIKDMDEVVKYYTSELNRMVKLCKNASENNL